MNEFLIATYGFTSWGWIPFAVVALATFAITRLKTAFGMAFVAALTFSASDLTPRAWIEEHIDSETQEYVLGWEECSGSRGSPEVECRSRMVQAARENADEDLARQVNQAIDRYVDARDRGFNKAPRE